MVLFNFRADRMVEMSKALEYADFKEFDRKRWPQVGGREGAGMTVEQAGR